MMEPTTEEMLEIHSIHDLMAWAKIGGDADWVPSPAATYMQLFGMSASTDIIDFASIEPADFEAVIPTWRYSLTENAYDGHIGEEVDLDLAPSLIMLGRARRCYHAARVWAKLEYSQDEIEAYKVERQATREARRQAKAESAAAHGFPTGGQQVIQLLAAPKTPPGDTINLNKVVDLTKNREIPVISTDMYAQCMAAYKELNWGLKPDAAKRPSIQQLTGLRELLRCGSCYVDFTVFVPHHDRNQKSRTWSGLVVASDGTLKTQEQKGPYDYPQWRGCCELYTTGMIMLRAAIPPTMKAYRKMMQERWELNVMCWALQYQCDDRVRHEEFPEMLITANEEHNKLVQADREILSNFTPDMPWNYVMDVAVTGSEARNWWYKQYDQRVIEVKLKTISLQSTIDNDAPVALSRVEHASYARTDVPTARPAFIGVEPPTKRPKTEKQVKQEQRQLLAAAGAGAGAVMNVSSQKSKFRPICPHFNSGRCQKADGKHNCPTNATKIHACDRCGAPGHMSSQCRTKEANLSAGAKAPKNTGKKTKWER